MKPIRQLLNRIHWDRDFGDGSFEIGIYDRIEDRVEYIPLEYIKTEQGNRFSFTMMRNGEMLSIPFHRVRAVKKNGETIWRR